MDVKPVILEGQVVRLEPLTIEHVAALSKVGLDPELWRLIPISATTPDEMHSYVSLALEEQKKGISLPFVMIDKVSNQVIGSTRYMNIDRANRRLEIGATWISPAYQRTAINTEAKLLLLTHAFEMLGAIRVELKTDALNEKSRKAILRIGATQEGIFRKHLIVPRSGRVRDTVYFSIIDTEWPEKKARLIGLCKRYQG